MDALYIAAIIAVAWLTHWETRRQCANAVLQGHRKWWKCDVFRAEHRVALRKYRRELDEVAELERSVRSK